MSASTTHLLRAPFLTEPVNPRRTLRELQALTGWDDRTTAKRLGVPYHTYRRWRTGRRPNPAALRLLAVYAGYVPWPGWHGWEVHDGLLFPPGERHGLEPEQVAAGRFLLTLARNP
jgi:transcriptional regulator with XRE-family HTH domain